MLLRVRHTTRYDYDEPVFLEPMIVRLRPRSSYVMRLERFTLRFDPEPSGRTELEDAEGNVVTRAWWVGTTTSVEINSGFEARALRVDPFDFVTLEPLRVPMDYPVEAREALARFRRPSGAADAFASEILGGSGPDALAFLDALTKHIRSHVTYEVRDDGEPRTAAQTLQLGSGACRDTAVLFMEACRSVGLAARFVSGYHGSPDPADTDSMHAWAEVFLPGAGWRGYDPTHGLAVADRHVAVAAAPSPAGAVPTQGTYRGAAGSSMRTHIEVTVD